MEDVRLSVESFLHSAESRTPISPSAASAFTSCTSFSPSQCRPDRGTDLSVCLLCLLQAVERVSRSEIVVPGPDYVRTDYVCSSPQLSPLPTGKAPDDGSQRIVLDSHVLGIERHCGAAGCEGDEMRRLGGSGRCVTDFHSLSRLEGLYKRNEYPSTNVP